MYVLHMYHMHMYACFFCVHMYVRMFVRTDLFVVV